jgi:hypothetical protein
VVCLYLAVDQHGQVIDVLTCEARYSRRRYFMLWNMPNHRTKWSRSSVVLPTGAR